jgi:LmbE family N-acetylglucosaminyl deacetylase
MTSPLRLHAVRGGLVFCLALVAEPSAAQEADAATLLGLAARLDRTARVLVITARPEDEPAGLVAWLHHGQGAEVGVLSIHRGESGLNRFQREVGEALGVLRVQEALRVRQVAGGRQFYTRAFDFGAPDTEATMWRRWPRESLLADLVTVIRSLRPHLLIVGCEIPGPVPDLQARAAIELAEAAFAAAGDGEAISPRQSLDRPPWQPTSLYQLDCLGTGPVLRIALGERHMPGGESYAQIGARAMAWQRSQGLGAITLPGSGEAALRLMRSLAIPADGPSQLFDGIPTSLQALAQDPELPPGRSARLAETAQSILHLQSTFTPADPARSVGAMTASLRLVRNALGELPDARPLGLTWVEEESDRHAALTLIAQRLTALALAAAGIESRLDAPQGWVAQGDSLPVTLTLFNSGPRPVRVSGGLIRFGLQRRLILARDSVTLDPGQRASWSTFLRGLDPTVPWWLASRREDDLYRYPSAVSPPPELLEGEGHNPHGRALVTLEIEGEELTLVTDPVSAVSVDPDRGEVREPLVVMPAVTVLLERVLDYSLADREFRRRLPVEIRSWTSRPRELTVRVEPPPGVRVTQPLRRLTLAAGERAELHFDLAGSLPRDRHALRVYVESEGETFVLGAIPIRYEHIGPVQVFRGAGLWLDAVPSRVPASAEIGYVPGEQDFNQVAFRHLGLRVTDLTAATLDSATLARLRRIAIGPGAFRSAELRRITPDLLEWVMRGGRLVVQSGGPELLASGLFPWPVTIATPPRDVSGQQVVLGPARGAERWWREPHQIDATDLDDWRWTVARNQPDSMDPRYRPLIVARHGSGEPDTPVAWATQVGEGLLIYTTLVLPPQVLAGEGGALRVLLNLLFAPGS